MKDKPQFKTLKAFLADLLPIVGASASLRFAFRDDKVLVSSIGPASYFFSEFPFPVGGKTDEIEDFQVPVASLQAAVTTESIQQPAELTATESTLVVKTKRALLEIATEAATEVLTEPPKPEGLLGSFTITAELQTFMKEVLPVLGLEKIHDAQQDFRLYGCFDKIAYLAVYSTQQVVYIASDNTFGVTGEFNVPFPSFSALMKSMPVGSKLGFAEDRIFARHESMFLMNLVTPLSTKEPPGELVRSKSKEISTGHKSAGMIVFKKADLEEFVASCKGVVSDDSPVVFTVGPSTILSVDTTSSRARVKLKPEKLTLEENFALELRLLKNIISKVGETVTLRYRNGVLLATSGALGLITMTYATK